ncbi:O-antigen ligase family protein [Vibrio sonorensis]|uniref:O-antigen ligase family protein n=1 Tax=Vibrio sonorensis TaxID=1004316 RepID=UPI001586F7D5|nr:O-antigen ligase family protein [Vibrio sonorensis]
MCSSLIFTDSFDDFFTFFRKGAVFLLFPLLLFQLGRSDNHKYATYSLALGLCLALIYAGKNLFDIGYSNWAGERIESFWDVGRWGELLGYSVALLLPFCLHSDQRITKKKTLAVSSILLLSILFLLLSGNRGPLLAVSITVAIYFLLVKPTYFLIFTLSFTSLIYFGNSIPALKPISERISSIADLQHNDSNNARLEMWKQGVRFSQHNISTFPMTLVWGTGIGSFEPQYSEFLKTNANIEQILKQTNHQFSFNDLHNTYLDLAVKLGIVYAIAFLGIILAMLYRFYLYFPSRSPWAYSGACLIVTYLINSFFYTSGLEYQTTVFFMMLALCLTQLELSNKSSEL